MELIRRNSDYALRSLTYMAGFPKGKRFTIAHIAKRQKAPKTFLKKIFQELAHTKIVAAYTGPNGGYELLKRPSQISMKDVVESLQGEVLMSECLVNKNFCDRQGECRVREKFYNIQDKIDGLFARTTIKEIAQ